MYTSTGIEIKSADITGIMIMESFVYMYMCHFIVWVSNCIWQLQYVLCLLCQLLYVLATSFSSF